MPYTRTDLRILWDITLAAGRGTEPTFASGGIAVHQMKGGPFTCVNEKGETSTGVVFTQLGADLRKNAIEIVYFGRIERLPAYGGLVRDGGWFVLEGRSGAVVFSRCVQPYTSKVLFEEDWHSLVHYSTEVLRLLGVEAEQARALAFENLQRLHPEVATAVDRATWGEVKARVGRR